ncbi:coiled-coil domain-containing protein 28B-like [Tubulanus polymorphus]|uniref:coiled-coil domain-containing protein 28B-like n=1 Tax=Tubulanus polymorphus TaxID=672921 RepID=UPI003DA46046
METHPSVSRSPWHGTNTSGNSDLKAQSPGHPKPGLSSRKSSHGSLQRQHHHLSSGKHVDSGGSNRPCKEHTFLTDVADVREMEQGLLQLLDDFHSGKLQAFGQDCTFEKMDSIREQQERLAKLHFEIDTQQDISGPEKDANSGETSNKNIDKLMDKLKELNDSILSLKRNNITTSGSRLQAKNSPRL